MTVAAHCEVHNAFKGALVYILGFIPCEKALCKLFRTLGGVT